MKENNFERNIDLNQYKIAKEIDAKSVTTIVLMNAVGFVIGLVTFFLGMLRVIFSEKVVSNDISVIIWLSMIPAITTYIILHELTHGIMYKAFTGEKLTFGITLAVAYCGVPHIYVKRKVAIIASIMPFVVFSIILIPLLFIINDLNIFLMILLLLSLHTCGCVGDIYITLLLLFKYKDKNVLVNDTGPKQTIYILKGEEYEKN